MPFLKKNNFGVINYIYFCKNKTNTDMKTITISKLLHITVMLTFLLPFFYTGCGAVKKEKPNQDSDAKVMTSAKEINDKDTNKIINPVDTSTVASTASTSKDTINKKKDKDDEQLSDKLVEKFPALSIILIPSNETYSGLGTLINLLAFIVWFSIFISFLFLLLGITIKIIEPNSITIIVILDILILIGILISKSPSWNSERLWGFWVCVVTTSILLAFDCYMLFKNKYISKKY